MSMTLNDSKWLIWLLCRPLLFLSLSIARYPIGSVIKEYVIKRTSAKHRKKRTCTRRRKQVSIFPSSLCSSFFFFLLSLSLLFLLLHPHPNFNYWWSRLCNALDCSCGGSHVLLALRSLIFSLFSSLTCSLIAFPVFWSAWLLFCSQLLFLRDKRRSAGSPKSPLGWRRERSSLAPEKRDRVSEWRLRRERHPLHTRNLKRHCQQIRQYHLPRRCVCRNAG